MIVEATFAHVLYVMERMREVDAAALRAVWGDLTPWAFSERRMAQDGAKFALVIDGTPVAIFGVDDASGVPVIWLGATDQFDRHWRKLYTSVRKMVNACIEAGYDSVSAFVLEGFTPGENVLASMGFARICPRAMGINGEVFTEFARTS